MTLHEISSIITRIGENCKLIVCGDYHQTDFQKDTEKHDISKIIKILNNMKSISVINFTVNDIVRSGLVKEFLISKENLKY